MSKLLCVLITLFFAPSLAGTSAYLRAQKKVLATDGRTCAAYLLAAVNDMIFALMAYLSP